MRKSGIFLRMLLLTGCLILLSGVMVEVAVAVGTAPEAETAAVTKPEAEAGDKIKEEELARLLAPIALYPDTLLMQMFMASTYPLEVVEAARFVKENSELKEDALDKALASKDWDNSVKSICHFPTVLQSLDEHLEATKKLGDFFLEDQKAVMDMVQTLRAKAREQGELKSTKEQKVIEKVVEKEKIIVIEPTDPQVVYVPSYSSTVVYGSWWYPSYPPYVWYPPPPAYGFVAGVAVGAWASHYWCHANWHHGDIDIDRNININRPGGGRPRTRPANGRQGWKHNPRHRKGVSYRNRDVRKRYGQSDRRARQQYISRGYGNRGLDRKTRDQIKRQGLKSNYGKFGQYSNRRTRPTNAFAGTRHNRADNSANRSRQSRNTNRKTSYRTGQTRNYNRNRATTNRASRTRSRNSFKRYGTARQTNRYSSRGRSSRSFSRHRGGGRMRGGGRRR